MRVPLLIVVSALAACGPTPYDDTRIDAAATSSDAAVVDSVPNTPDAPYVACPPGLPDSFGQLGFVTTTKNGPGSPAMYDSFNVFADLLDNPRWFFAMNLHVNEGVFAAGFMLDMPYDIAGSDTEVPTCALCINLFADLDTTEGGPSLHMFGRMGRLVITSQSTDDTRVSGRLEDVIFDAIKIVYDDDSPTCSGVNDPICGNSICLSNRCGRQQLLEGCSTSIKSMTF